MKWAIQAKEEEKNKPQTFSADGWTGNQRSSQMWWRNEQELLPPEPRTARNKWAKWLGRGEREGDKGAKEFCPGWRHQPGPKPTLLSMLDLLSRLVAPTGAKGCCHPPTPPAWLAVGPWTKATFGPGPNGRRDKWSGPKACSVVVYPRLTKP